MTKQRFIINRTLVYIAVLILLAIMLFPFAVMIVSMLKSADEIYHIPTYWFPKNVRFQNFVDVWEAIPLGIYFKSSLIISLGAVLVNTLVSIPAGYAVARLRFTGRKFILYVFLVTQMFSPVIVIISLFKIVVAVNLVDTYLSLILANAVFTIPFTIWMLNGYFSGIPVGIEEAARIDGCTRLGALTRVILPIAAPGIVTTTIYTFIFAWNEFLFAITFIQSKGKTPLTVGLYQFVGRFSVEWELLLAAAFLAILPVLVLFYLVEKRLVTGLAGGAIKG